MDKSTKNKATFSKLSFQTDIWNGVASSIAKNISIDALDPTSDLDPKIMHQKLHRTGIKIQQVIHSLENLRGGGSLHQELMPD